MRRNPLLYSDQADYEEPVVVEEPVKKPRSFLFYFIILINSLLVLLVLGLIWFLFLKSPDFHLKEYIDRYFGSQTPPNTLTSTAETTPGDAQVTENVPEVLTKQQQEEVQQARLKQMREQEALEAERLRLEKLREEIAAEREKAELAQKALAEQTAAAPKAPSPDQPTVTEPVNNDTMTLSNETQQPESTQTTAASEPATVNNDTLDTASVVADTESEPAIVPNAASEVPTPPENTVDTQVDQIMETLRLQQAERAAEAAARTE